MLSNRKELIVQYLTSHNPNGSAWDTVNEFSRNISNQVFAGKERFALSKLIKAAGGNESESEDDATEISSDEDKIKKAPNQAPLSQDEQIVALKSWLEKTLGANEDIINYIALSANFNGFLCASQSATTFWADQSNLLFVINENSKKFTFSKEELTGDIIFTEEYSIDSLHNSDGKPISEKIPVAKIITVSKIALVEGKIQHTLLSDKTILLDISCVDIFKKGFGNFHIGIDVSQFTELASAECAQAPAMNTFNATGRNTVSPEKIDIQFDIDRGVVFITDLSEEEIKQVANKHQQDLFTAVTDLITDSNPNLQCTENEASLNIYKNDSRIFADCLVHDISLTTDLADDSKKIKIPGTILFRYEWINDNWKIQFRGTTDDRLKRLLLGQYPELDEARKINTKLIGLDKVIQKNNPPIPTSIQRVDRETLEDSLNLMVPAAQAFIEKLGPKKLLVSGKLSSRTHTLTRDIDQFQNALRIAARDQRLTLEFDIADQNILCVKTQNKIAAFEEIGLSRDSSSNMYILDLSNQHNNIIPHATDPLLAIKVTVQGKDKLIDISRLYNNSELTELNKKIPETSIIAPTYLEKDEKLYKAIRKVNQYMSKRAGETSWLSSFWINSYNGRDYYERRNSWESILNDFNTYNANPTPSTYVTLINLINKEIETFKKTFSRRNEYSSALENLLILIPKNDKPINPHLKDKILNYEQLYNQMDWNRNQTKNYQEQHAFYVFSKPKENIILEDNVRREKKLYDMHYQLLDKNDKEDFLSMSEEFDSEYNNTQHYRY